MITLDRLESKLNAIMKRQDQDREAISSWISGVEQSQGKLLAALREDMDKLLQSHAALETKLKEVDAGLHETAMRNHQQVRHDLAALYAKPKRKKVRR